MISSLLLLLASGSILYFFIVNTLYLLLVLTAVFSLTKQRRAKPLTETMTKLNPAFAPSISILAPAYNEQETVVDSVHSFLSLNYPSFEVLVINDGSKDETLARLKKAFQLEESTFQLHNKLSKSEVKGVYVSKVHPNLRVIDKANGGKADALNVGIEFSQHEIFCAVDSDSLLENDALHRVALPFFEDPLRVVASGGTVRIANGAVVKHRRIQSVTLPKNFFVLMQVIEYTRAFLCGRIGWNVLNSTLVISGAFGLFSKRAVQAVGGYSTGCIGEDMELIIRLHKYHRDLRKPYRIVFVADPVCWTEAPADRQSLGKQRDRWQRGLADTLVRNRSLLFNPRYGFIGLIALPYFLFVELLGPIFELASLMLVASATIYTDFDLHILWVFFVASILYGAVLSMTSLLIEEVYFSKYSRPPQFMALFFMCLVESIWYRQFSTFWRFKGLVKYVRGDHSWGALTRKGFGGGN